MTIVETLARTGITCITVMDPDRVELLNLDRLHGATRLDAILRRPKAKLARRILRTATTALDAQHAAFDHSVCEPAGFEVALDHDIVFCCVDRPWPRHVLNVLAYHDLIPVIDGGIAIQRLANGAMRNAYWQTTVARPGAACFSCVGQYRLSDVQLERDGSLETESYLQSLPSEHPLRARQNVAAISLAAAGAQLAHFLSLVASPSGVGDPGTVRHNLALHSTDARQNRCVSGCAMAASVGLGDSRLDPCGVHQAAQRARADTASLVAALTGALRLGIGAVGKLHRSGRNRRG